MELPRRINLDLNTSAELAIYNAIQEVEKCGADVRLTEVSIMLQNAKNLLSDYVDAKYEKWNGKKFDPATSKKIKL